MSEVGDPGMGLVVRTDTGDTVWIPPRGSASNPMVWDGDGWRPVRPGEFTMGVVLDAKVVDPGELSEMKRSGAFRLRSSRSPS